MTRSFHTRAASSHATRSFLPGHRQASSGQTTSSVAPAWADRTERATRRAAWTRRHTDRQARGNRTSLTGLVGSVLVLFAMLSALSAPQVTPVKTQPVVTITAEAPSEAPAVAEAPAIALDAVTVTAERL